MCDILQIAICIPRQRGLYGDSVGSRDFIFFAYFQTALGSIYPPVQWVARSFLVVNRPGCGDDHPPHLAISLLPLCTCMAGCGETFTCTV